MVGWRSSGHAAVVVGGANGIGFAAARQFLQDGMDVLIADRDHDALERARADLQQAATGGNRCLMQPCDVTDMAQVTVLREKAFDELGKIHCLMNNAGAGLNAGLPWENLERWKAQLDVNLWGIIHGCQAFVPAMLEAGDPGVVINTGSKQGITNPPSGYAYNLSKAGVRAYTESLAHALRATEGCGLTAHLLVPGFTYTNMVARFVPEKPPAAWTAEQVIDFMLPRLGAGDFYILCPDNDVTREMDEKRIQWNTDDIIKNRPALSRWHPDYADAFARFMDD